jgi:hypothetical protein
MMNPQETGQLNVSNLQDTAKNVVYAFCSVFAMPVEVILRPWYGTRFHEPAFAFFSIVAMLILSMASSLMSSSFIPPLLIAARIQRPHALFGIGSLCELFLFLLFLHGLRLYRRMWNMSLEMHSQFEGPALPFFQLLPGGGSFWFTRIVLEPAFVILTAFVLNRLFIFRDDLEAFLIFSGLCLAMKSFISWYVQWEMLRKIFDMQYAGPIIASLVEGQANPKDLERIHLASFPNDVPSDIRKSAAVHIARVVSGGTINNETRKEHSHANNE